jgi:hypothetical protein
LNRGRDVDPNTKYGRTTHDDMLSTIQQQRHLLGQAFAHLYIRLCMLLFHRRPRAFRIARLQFQTRLSVSPRSCPSDESVLGTVYDHSPKRRYAAKRSTTTSGMSKTGASSKAKKPRPKVPDYCDVEPRRDEEGQVIWPAAKEAMEQARDFIREWYV